MVTQEGISLLRIFNYDIIKCGLNCEIGQGVSSQIQLKEQQWGVILFDGHARGYKVGTLVKLDKFYQASMVSVVLYLIKSGDMLYSVIHSSIGIEESRFLAQPLVKAVLVFVLNK